MIPIPYAMSYRTTVSGQVPKLVQCEQCGLEFVYFFQATSQGQGTSLLFLDNEGARERSQSVAEAHLRATLQMGCAVVPCPGCGHVQKHMIPQARKERHRWMNKAALAAFIAGGVLMLPTMAVSVANSGPRSSGASGMSIVLWSAVALLGAAAIALPCLRLLLRARYDPNREPLEARKRAGQEFAIPKEEFLRAAQEETS